MDTFMKSRLSVAIQYFNIVFFSVLFFSNQTLPKGDQLQFKSDNLTIDFGGKFNNELYSSCNLGYLNNDIGNDTLFYARTTFDFYSTFLQGDYEKPRLVFYDTVRFRFKWGSQTDVRTEAGSLNIADTKFAIQGTATNKHLLWMRESWLKLRVGALDDHNNYFQIGLIPYQVGRGISLGAAYDAAGFLGFVPGSPIDQFAPAVLFSFNPIANRLVLDLYTALVENRQTSLFETTEKIRDHELNACPLRGVGRQSYINAIRSEVIIYNSEKKKVTFEPYLVHQHAPDQDLEFQNDVDSYLSTAGAAIESVGERLSWGFEGACNFGELDVKPWDRNYDKVSRDSNGFLIEQYTKVYTQDPATVVNPKVAPHTNAVAALLSGSPHDRSMNGKLVGTVDIDVNGIPTPTPIYNAFDRFRPEQRRILSGYFFIADAAYDCIPNVVNVAVGLGYASGFVDEQRNVNTMSTEELMNEPYTGFLPLQSIYSGKRLRHLVLFNQGVPRFNVRVPNANLARINATSVLQPDIVNEMTNIAFLGTRLDWKIQAFKKYSVDIAQNIIAYWSPETASISQLVTLANGFTELQPVEKANNFIGTELTTEFSMLFYKKIKLAGYVGVLIPGGHYADMCGTLIGKNNLPSGKDLGYVGNVSLAYYF